MRNTRRGRYALLGAKTAKTAKSRRPRKLVTEGGGTVILAAIAERRSRSCQGAVYGGHLPIFIKERSRISGTLRLGTPFCDV